MASSSLDTSLNKLRPSLIAIAITVMRETNVSLYVHGAPGISKSAVARQVADNLGIAFIDLRLSQMAPEDVRGVPMLGEIDGMSGVIWQPPLSFPRELDYDKTELVEGVKSIRFFNPIGSNEVHYCTNPNIVVQTDEPTLTLTVMERRLDRFTVQLRDVNGKPASGLVRWQVTGQAEAILALEEFNSAPPSVMAAAYQLILDRRLGDYIVPSRVMLLAMGNRDGDKGVTYKLPKPIANRMVHLEMECHHGDWQEWALAHGINPMVIGFLAKWQSKLFDHDFAKSPDHRFASPRAWEFVAKVCDLAVTKDVKRALICGAVGDATGSEFLLHCQFLEEMPDIRAIFDGTATTFITKNPQYTTQIAYSLCVQLCYDLRARSDDTARTYRVKSERDKSPEQIQLWVEADRAMAYLIDNFPPEIAIMAQTIALRNYKLYFSPPHMKRFAQFARQYSDVVLG